jgi:hypothetical protein
MKGERQMTRGEFLELEVGDRVYLSLGKTDREKLCVVTDIFPLMHEVRPFIERGTITAKVLDGEFKSGDINPDGSKTLHYKCWKKRSNFITQILEKIGD